MAEGAIRVQNWEWPDLVTDHHARVISDRKWPLKKRSVIAHIKARSKYSFLTINRFKRSLIRPNLACKRIPGSVCPVCVNASFIASGLAWHYEPVLCRWSEWLDFGDGWACLQHGVTFEHRQVLPWAVKGEGMSVNEAVYIPVL
jgi:hypothetical protein